MAQQDERVATSRKEFHDNVRDVFDGAYDQFDALLIRHFTELVRAGLKEINCLEIGCGPSNHALKHLNSNGDIAVRKLYIDNEIHEMKDIGEDEFLHADFMEDFEVNGKNWDLVVARNVLHELHLHSNHGTAEFLEIFFQKVWDILSDGGIFICGDPFYPSYMEYEHIMRNVANQREICKHADPPVAFLDPEYILRSALSSREDRPSLFNLLDETEESFLSEIPGGIELQRNFYLFALQKNVEVRAESL